MSDTRLRRIRLGCGISLSDLGRAAGLSQQHISRIELLEIPATPGHEALLQKALLRLIDSRINDLFRMRRVCTAHAGHLLEILEESENE